MAGPGVDGVAEQHGHRVAGGVGEGAVEGEVGEGAVAVLPGGEGEQGSGCGDVSGLGVAGQVGPQPPVGGAWAGSMRAQASSRTCRLVRVRASQANWPRSSMARPSR